MIHLYYTALNPLRVLEVGKKLLYRHNIVFKVRDEEIK